MIKYQLKDYVQVLASNHLIVEANLDERLLNTKISLVSYYSKEVEKNSIFICKGLNFKSEYLKEAVDLGALIYISEEKYIDYPHIIVSDIHKSLALLANLYYDYPAKDMDLIGITGTKGKTTTAFFTKSIIDEYEKNCGILSSIINYDGASTTESLITTPESLDIYKYIRNAKENNIKTMVMEVSSQALKYDRVYNIHYKVGVFTNIGVDHISSIEHPDFEDYFHSKLSLFNNCEIVCLNLDSDYIDSIVSASFGKKVFTYSMHDDTADLYAYDIKKIDATKYSFKVKTSKFNTEFILPMMGEFNIYNALASITVAYALDIPVEYIYKGLLKSRVPGRMETFSSKDKNTIAIVDYAHNKLSLESLLSSVKKEYPDKRVITVFGSVGGKAKNRRKELGVTANLYADFIYLTTDDPGIEEVSDICNEIAAFIPNHNYKVIENRALAIKEAILNNIGSVIVVTGKGIETHQKKKTLEDYEGDIFYVQESLKEIEELTFV